MNLLFSGKNEVINHASPVQRYTMIFFRVLLGFSLFCSATFYAHAKTEYVSIGTGGVSGVYYPTGGAICYLLNQSKQVDSISCEIKSTPGSIFNLQAIKSGEVDLAVVQSDWQYHAYNGSSLFANSGPFKKLRALFSVHAEPFTVLARKDANIKKFTDIKGKRINIGAPNSGQRATMEMLLKLYGWQYSDFSALTSLNPSEQAQALCDGKVDAIVYVVGHPNNSIKEASSACETVLIPIEGDIINELVAQHSYYNLASIPGQMYKGNDQATPTFGVGATILTTSDLPEHVAYEIVKAVFENHDTFIHLHHAFTDLTKKAMLTQYLSTPLHPGALRYYREAGLIDG